MKKLFIKKKKYKQMSTPEYYYSNENRRLYFTYDLLYFTTLP